MQTLKRKDKIIFLKDKILHESAGGFVFYESHLQDLYVALLKNEKGKFVLPKGHIQKGESPESAALREIKEELGIKAFLKLIGFVGQSRYKFQDYTDKRMHFKRVNLFVFSSKKMANLSPQTSEGFIDAKWLKVEDAVRKLAFDKKLLLKAATIYKKSSQETKFESKVKTAE